jgi:CBS domain-containing protein
MKVGEYCKRSVISIRTTADVAEAAKLMRDQHVGFLVVCKEGESFDKPSGVLTDRDIVLQMTAKDVSPRAVRVEEVMTRQPLIANEADDLNEVLQGMRLAGVRRVPVVDARGMLTGIFAVDDAIDLVTGLLCEIAGSIKSELRQEWIARSG